MLFTSCPDCRTTFRITVETLRQADGDVRCGQCTAVFSAFDELTDEPPSNLQADTSLVAPTQGETSAETVDEPTIRDQIDASVGIDESADTATSGDGAASADDSEEDLQAPAVAEASVDEAPGSAALDNQFEIEFQDSANSADAAIAPLQSATEELQSESAEITDWEFSDQQVDDVLHEDDSAFPESWPIETAPTGTTSQRNYWSVGALAVGALLALQVAHHFRENLSGMPVIGQPMRTVYAWLGSPLPGSWTPGAYEIVNWSTASQSEPNSTDRLSFTASIRNVSNAAKPLPLVHLKLTDRWEQAIGSRYFEPEEYLADSDSRPLELAGGATADIRLDLVDPGPSAYGFEVDVCVEISGQALRCSADRVFQ